jgi:ferredoxin, 2Fe-2S
LPNVSLTTRDGTERLIDAPVDESLMEAVRAETSDTFALCGGACSCATCHVYVDDGGRNSLPPMSEGEDGLLDGCEHRREQSRLSCQIKINDSHQGLRVEIAPEEEE